MSSWKNFQGKYELFVAPTALQSSLCGSKKGTMPMSSATRWVLILAVIACAGAAYFLLSYRHEPQQQAIVPEQAPPPPPAPSTESTEALTRHPVPEPETKSSEPAKPLPALEDSDVAIQESLSRVFDPQRLGEVLVFKDFINRFVVTVDNLPRSKLPVQHLPGNLPRGKFMVKKEGGETVIDPENDKRYTRYVQLFEGMDSRKIAAVYFHFYPLFQEAYADLGYKSAYFNDRLIEAIDDLLATPEVKDPIKLVQPSVFYKYADPRLEGLSAGERLMIRIGDDNAARVKVKLRELRDALTHRATDN
jgi:Protein of unknown function (DUF3014)